MAMRVWGAVVFGRPLALILLPYKSRPRYEISKTHICIGRVTISWYSWRTIKHFSEL